MTYRSASGLGHSEKADPGPFERAVKNSFLTNSGVQIPFIITIVFQNDSPKIPKDSKLLI